MSSSIGDWAALESRHERLMESADSQQRPAEGLASSTAVPWAELASQRERLVEFSGPQLRPPRSGPRTSEFRLVVKAA